MVEVIRYKCEFCGQEHESKEWMQLHEECCPLNPKNQPCSTCNNHILGVGCGKRVNMDSIQGNVKCFCYDEGHPVNPFNMQGLGNFLAFNGNNELANMVISKNDGEDNDKE